jgi:hypothetical protein
LNKNISKINQNILDINVITSYHRVYRDQARLSLTKRKKMQELIKNLGWGKLDCPQWGFIAVRFRQLYIALYN